MDFDALRYFLAVAEAGSVSKAATKLGVTQPALSRQVQRLESLFGTPFFYRNGRGVALTQSGRTLVDHAGQLLRQYETARSQINEQIERPCEAVTLGLPPSFGSTLAASVALRYREVNPRSRLQVREAFSSTLLEWVESGRIDVAVQYEARRGRNQLVSPLLQEELFVVESPLGGRRDSRVSAAELGRMVFALPGMENGLRRVIDRTVRQHGLPLNVDMEIDSVPALKRLVEVGPWSTILPFGAVQAEVAAGRLSVRPLAFKMQALLVTATPTNRPVSRAVSSLLAIIHAEVERAVSEGLLRGCPSAGPSQGTARPAAAVAVP
ncbi:LysR family transcriptional regulator [Roseateles violae]|uniref:LysR family transcriptional regulator n=1 Tax=Roseateles violae TaxID=3058042 RepID=A0ABT8DWN5_9BURK|nr:LysR family transcriptional regulator [Pelomonas sp. PFR6]MDN3921478.1 LysR family transcriptional regulator [Pelomonas sp. PFR6]